MVAYAAAFHVLIESGRGSEPRRGRRPRSHSRTTNLRKPCLAAQATSSLRRYFPLSLTLSRLLSLTVSINAVPCLSPQATPSLRSHLAAHCYFPLCLSRLISLDIYVMYELMLVISSIDRSDFISHWRRRKERRENIPLSWIYLTVSINIYAILRNARVHQILFKEEKEGTGMSSNPIKPSVMASAAAAFMVKPPTTVTAPVNTAPAAAAAGSGGGDEFDTIGMEFHDAASTSAAAATPKGEPQKRPNEDSGASASGNIPGRTSILVAFPSYIMYLLIIGAVFTEPKPKQSKTQKSNARRRRNRQSKQPLFEKSVPINDPNGGPLTLHQWREMRVCRPFKHLNSSKINFIFPISIISFIIPQITIYNHKQRTLADLSCHMDYGHPHCEPGQVPRPRQADHQSLHVDRRQKHGCSSGKEPERASSDREEGIWTDPRELSRGSGPSIPGIPRDFLVLPPGNQSQVRPQNGEERTRHQSHIHDYYGHSYLQGWRRTQRKTMEVHTGETRVAYVRWIPDHSDVDVPKDSTGGRQEPRCSMPENGLDVGRDHQATTYNSKREDEGRREHPQHPGRPDQVRAQTSRRRRQEWHLEVQIEYNAELFVIINHGEY